MGNGFPKHKGGGYYETSDGKSIRGRDAALAHEAGIGLNETASGGGPNMADPHAGAKTRKIKRVYRTVFGPPSAVGGRDWTIAGVSQQLRFNRKGEAELLVSVDGEDITTQFSGDHGLEDVRVDKIVERQAELSLGDERSETVTVPADGKE